MEDLTAFMIGTIIRW